MPPTTPTDPPLLPHDAAAPPRILRAVGRERSTDWETVDWTYEREAHLRFKERKAANHREENEGIATLWFRAREAFSGWAPVLIVGCVTGVLAGMIDFSCSFLSSLRFGVCKDMPWLGFDACCPGSETHEECGYWRQWGETLESETLTWCVYCTVSVSFAVLASHLVVTYAPYAAGSGIPEIKTILSGISINRFLGAWTLLIKCVGLCLAVGSGLSLGKEGPFVHVASCVGNLVTDYYPSYKHHESKRREVLSASCAAGVAVAFGAPIGGVLFSLEEASYYFPHKTMWKAFFCAVVAALVLKSIDPSNSGTLALFRLGYNHPWRWFELLPHCLLGGMGGVVGALFNALNVRWIRFKRTSEIKAHPVLEVFVVASVTALVNYRSPFLKASATEVLSKIFRECGPGDTTGLCDLESQDLRVSLVLAAVCKFWLTVFTFGSKVPAGLFVPSLFTGACLGRVMGMWVHGLHVQARSSYLFSECIGVPVNQCVIPGVYAVVGAAAVLGGVTRMTLSLVVIIFELTGGLEYLVPVIVAVMLSKIVGEWVGGEESIYERHIIMNGYPYLDPKAEAREGMAVRDLLPDTPSLYAIPNTGWTVSRVQHLLHTTTYKGFPIIRSKKERVVVGWAQRARLIKALDAAATFPQVGPETGVVFSGDVRNNGPACLLDASTFIDATPIQITADATVGPPSSISPSPSLCLHTHARTPRTSGRSSTATLQIPRPPFHPRHRPLHPDGRHHTQGPARLHARRRPQPGVSAQGCGRRPAAPRLAARTRRRQRRRRTRRRRGRRRPHPRTACGGHDCAGGAATAARRARPAPPSAACRAHPRAGTEGVADPRTAHVACAGACVLVGAVVVAAGGAAGRRQRPPLRRRRQGCGKEALAATDALQGVPERAEALPEARLAPDPFARSLFSCPKFLLNAPSTLPSPHAFNNAIC